VGLHRSHLEALSSIGYWMRADLTGKGYTTEATAGLLAFAFEAAGMYRVELRAGVENRASQRVAEKLGFTREGVLRRGCPVSADRAYDCYLYGLLSEDWRRGA
jgi:ribosomal-protein-serine acetyltransferase